MKDIIFLSVLLMMLITAGCSNRTTITRDGLTLCEQDSDCIIVDYNGCCSQKLAINKKYKDIYESNPQLRKDNLTMCAYVDCLYPPNKEFKAAKCQEGKSVKRCTLIP